MSISLVFIRRERENGILRLVIMHRFRRASGKSERNSGTSNFAPKSSRPMNIATKFIWLAWLGLASLLMVRGSVAQEYFQKDTIELELNRATGEDAYLTFIRREGTKPAERLAVAIPVILRGDEGESGAGISPEIKLTLKNGSAEIAATGTLESGKPADAITGTYRVKSATERAIAEKTRSESLDVELNRVYGEVKAKLTPARAAALKDLQREWIHSVYTPEPIAEPRDDPAGEHWRNQADHAAERIRFLREYAAGHAESGPPTLQAQLQAAEEAEAWPSVAEIARHMLANSAKDSALWEKRARAFASAEDWKRCAAVLDEWSKAVSQHLPAMDSLRGDVALAEDRETDAIEAWNACIRAAPKDVETRDKLADLLEDRGNWTESVKIREQRVKIEATADSLAALSIAHALTGNWKAAGADIHRASAVDATNDAVHHEMPRIERAQKAMGDIKKLEKEIAEAKQNVAPLLEHGIFFFDLGWPEIAVKDADDAQALWPQSRGALLLKAVGLMGLNRREDAEKLEHVSVVEALKNPSVLGAIAKADAELQANGPSAPLLARRGHQLNRVKQYELSALDTAEALKLDANCDTALAVKGEALVADSDYWTALPDVKRAIELNPKNELALYLRGVIESKHHNYPDAVEALSKVLEIRPGDREALQLREKSYRELGRVAEADADLKLLNKK